jgi:hypothetical protein
LTLSPNDFSAQPVHVRSFGTGEIVRRILARNPGLSEAQINAALDEFIREACLIIEDGGAINTPLLNTQPSIAGVFHGAADTFDPRRHRVKTNISQGTAMRRATTAIKTQKVQTAEPIPYILEVHDVLSDTVNELLTPGGVLQIRGGRLKMMPDNPDNGIFLTDDTGMVIKMPVVIENKPARLIVMIPPDLPAGSYELEVRTTLSASGKEVKSIRTRRFNRELTAVSDE